ncbi:LysR family transcriptional regulator [Pedosphaera parvula]|uniref:Transcriptional regulator, LysR family n=1 Tax=Pedosphaera parvula (strain Ellin514) TaxID=320771 RepID=B9XFS0_PEDPL|nr:LysR family transcriptional regulator [Pedosphaera parvula]EEF61434.1 transcriptional regulator, LysR family [Pedosphaera parvula Ellin514]
MLAQLRSFLVVVEEGSLHRAAARLRISQSALTRQMQALEHDLGGRLLERTSAGVKPTSAGYAAINKLRPALAQFDDAMGEVRRLLRGENEQLRIGYIASAAKKFLEPALIALRKQHPKLKLKLLDLTPGEQIAGLRRGEIDLAMTPLEGNLSRDFHIKKLATLPMLAVLPTDHPLAGKPNVWMKQLKDERFVGGSEKDLPGYNRWFTQLCRKTGRFKPRFIQDATNLPEALELVSNEGAVTLLSADMQEHMTACFAMVPIADPEATFDLFVVWQRGRTSDSLRTLLDSLSAIYARSPMNLQKSKKLDQVPNPRPLRLLA